MNYLSTEGRSPAAGFREAVLAGLAPDGGLYVPESLPLLPQAFLEDLSEQNLQSIGFEAASTFIDDIPPKDLAGLMVQAWTFPIPLVHLRANTYLLELFHGPTLAFKDIGVRFLARVLSYYLAASRREITIVVATSGDTGSAVAHGFYGVPHTDVYVLYPSGRISRLQEQQMATLGGNIHAVEVEGTFDDCQQLVKQALADREVLEARHLTTANSINLGRLLPQIAYYVWGAAQMRRIAHGTGHGINPSYVVPSGNFGNLTAAVYAKAMGTPMGNLVAATNVNDVGAEYLRTGTFVPRASVQTYSNAMDVGNPSNLARVRAHCGDNPEKVRALIDASSVTDDQTLKEMRAVYEESGRVVDPHTAVGLAVARRKAASVPTIVVATAHPGKFPEVVERALGIQIPLPPALVDALRRPKLSLRMPADFAEFKNVLLASPPGPESY